MHRLSSDRILPRPNPCPPAGAAQCHEGLGRFALAEHDLPPETALLNALGQSARHRMRALACQGLILMILMHLRHTWSTSSLYHQRLCPAARLFKSA